MKSSLKVFLLNLSLLSSASLAFSATVTDSTKQGFGALSPDAPPQTAQFDFLIGEWHCEITRMGPDGNMQQPSKATWTGRYVLDGWAIEDVWQPLAAGARPGVNIRSFNPETKLWDNRWLGAGTLQWQDFQAEQVNDTMVMTGEGTDARGRRYIDRNTFYEITDGSWRWRKDRSFDDGATWLEGVARTRCFTPYDPALPAEARQFDFWLGQWDVNLRIKRDGEWPEASVSARAEIYPILHGKAVLELWNSDPIKGLSLRYFDTAQDKWLLWLNWPGQNRSGSNGLSGTFRHGRGDFYSERPTQDGGTLISRYSFNDITPTSLRWDDSFSDDGGETWRHGWRMEFSRTAQHALLPAEGGAGHTQGQGQWCTLEQFDKFRDLTGTLTGTLTTRQGQDWSESPATVTGYPVLEGCVILALVSATVDGRPFQSFHQLTWNTYASVFEETVLDSFPSSAMRVYYGPERDAALIMNRNPVFGEEITPARRSWQIDDGQIVIEESVSTDGKWSTSTRLVLER